MYEVGAVCYIIPHCGHLFRGYFTAAFCVTCTICGLNSMYWWRRRLVEVEISVPVTKSLIDLRRTCTVPHTDCTTALLDICECCFVVTVLETCTETPEVCRLVVIH